MHTEADFDVVFVKLLPRLQSRTAQLVGDRHLGEELVQEVYVRLKSSSTRQRGLLEHPNPYAYALTATMNLARSRWRAERRWVVREHVDAGVWQGAAEGDEFVAGLLRQLTGKEASALLLVDLADRTLEDAARLLGVHKGTVQRNRVRALAKLRAVLVRDHQTSR
ncbi:sigma factor-like helix-turn-helix DNA-binding protein [Lentzea sp. BCCO 10_0061]|uniref:Sigma factor-like helix-turn-helix DNA-binding protein n=1 Tax=Lentzea sokolovensis TaxID=3095429 RepID=A0ABU4V5Y8_9PSEU|nr:sigma factor-like helix-turn-helix DNA-binding protein [Lentzea sp. BCCO 10_0061]MDX8146659.1 sigma factor-like helix-turn-helix DNA-binding protein [Lentzea sp. BCCO 10_0061]